MSRILSVSGLSDGSAELVRAELLEAGYAKDLSLKAGFIVWPYCTKSGGRNSICTKDRNTYEAAKALVAIVGRNR